MAALAQGLLLAAEVFRVAEEEALVAEASVVLEEEVLAVVEQGAVGKHHAVIYIHFIGILINDALPNERNSTDNINDSLPNERNSTDNINDALLNERNGTIKINCHVPCERNNTNKTICQCFTISFWINFLSLCVSAIK